MDRGINELFEGVTITRGDSKTVLPPSSFAEAQIAFMKPEQFRHDLEELARASLSDTTTDFPTLRRAAKRHGGRLYEVLEEKIKGDHKGASHLLEGNPIVSEGLSGGGIFYTVVKSRGGGNREVTLILDDEGNIMKLVCQCPTYLKNIAKSNYGKMVDASSSFGNSKRGSKPKVRASNGWVDLSGFPVFDVGVACYHAAASLIYIARKKGKFTVPFEIGTVQATEALFMDKVSKKKEATIDDYLLRQGALTEETKRQISDGEMTLEVIKHMKEIDRRSQEIILRVKERMQQEGYSFSGFATDFRGTEYSTASIVLTKPDGRSVHLVHDSKLDIDLPLVMLKVPLSVWIGSLGKEPVSREMPENPLQSYGSYVASFDERTQREVVSIITRPAREILRSAEIAEYNRLVPTRPMLPQLPN